MDDHMQSQQKTSSDELPESMINNQMGNKSKRSFDFGLFTLVLLTVFLFAAAQVIVVFVLGLFLLTQGEPIEQGIEQLLSSNIYNFYIIAAMSVVQFFMIRFFLRLQGKSLRSVGLAPLKMADLPRALLGWLTYMATFFVIILVLEGLDTGIDFDQEQQLEFTPTRQTVELLAIYASIVIAPAFIEELLMRGFLFMGLRKSMGFWSSAMVVSLIFGVAHLQFGTGEPLLWSAFADTFVLSIVLCYLTERYKTLWPAILVHAIKNSLAFMIIFIFGR